MKCIASLVCALVATGCSTTTTDRLRLPQLETVAHVDLSRYIGTWYEIANFPQIFQRGCTATTASYTLRGDGDIDVLNRCRKESIDGEQKAAVGRAHVVDLSTNAKLVVSFFRPFWGDYWIIDLAEDYSYAVVGHPSRDYLWILSRTPSMDPGLYEGILRRLAAQGYETSRIVRTLQPPRPTARDGSARTCFRQTNVSGTSSATRSSSRSMMPPAALWPASRAMLEFDNEWPERRRDP